MKWKLLLVVFGLGLACPALAQPATFYFNDGVFRAPPQIPPSIDALNFVNRNQFIINFTNQPQTLPPPAPPPPFETLNTLNYTNTGGSFMSCNMGFRMETFNSQTSQRQRAANVYNAGTINCGTAEMTNLFLGGVKFLVSATNITSPGTINMGFDSLLSLKGNHIDLNRGAVTMEDVGFNIFSGGAFFNGGLLDGYWGLGSNVMNPAIRFEIAPPDTPFHLVTNRNYNVFFQRLVLSNAPAYISDTISGSNRTVRAVFLSNTNPAFTLNVYFPLGATAVEWAWSTTNSLGMVTNQYLYLFDWFGFTTNFQLLLNGFAGTRPTFIPFNYDFFRTGAQFSLGPPALPGPLPSGVFDFFTVTNQYSAYEALFQPTSALVSDIAGQNVTNLPGRIEIAADTRLNLSRARISSLNYLLLKATNHFVSSSNAQIVSPWIDLNLRTTNGLLAITNLVAPTVPRLEGTIDLWSGRWTNVVASITNTFHVLFVDSRIAPTSPARIQDVTLRSTNVASGSGSVLISDVLNVTRNILIEAEQLTLTTNQPGSPTATGVLNFLSPDILWPTSTPRLQYLTNNGTIQTLNAVFFGGSRFSPFFSTNFNEPYQVFVNRGSVTNFGSVIWANDFQNSGTFFSGSGPIELQHSKTAHLADGAFIATRGEIVLASDSLLVSNHLLQAGSSLTLAVTNKLDDGSLTNTVESVTNKNSWIVTNGFNLTVRPAQSSLRATTVGNVTAPFGEAIYRWAGEDRGCSPAGFTNNAAVGRLILDGGQDGLFIFTGTDAANAIYVDYLELRNSTTHRNAAGDFTGVQINPNMKVYFAQAIAVTNAATGQGTSIAEKLDGRNGGRLCWVSDYHDGFFSSTNIVYPDGTTNRFNAALVQSCNLDSDGDGIVNCADPTPIFIPSSLMLSVSVTNTPPLTALVSWDTLANSTNYLYYKTNLAAPDWQLLTNFVFGPVSGRATVTHQAGPVGRFYKVRIETPRP